jgi:glycosyltransferase involved in cell wall biosynthesis
MLNLFTVQAKLCVVDLHDIVKPELITEKVRKNVKLYFVKSNYHSTMIESAGIDKSQIVVIPNGGAYEEKMQFLSETKKDPFYLIYASSYDRGLAYMLKWGWPKIKKVCPQAYLKIFYGWDGFDAIQKNNHDAQLYKKIVQTLMKQDGVHDMGRVPQEQLLLEKARATIHYYVGDFQEIDCISVRESACLGTIPVVSAQALVFNEKSYCVRIDGDPHKKETHEAAAEKICQILLRPKEAEKLRSELVVPLTETWENTARKWLQVLENENIKQ